MDDSGNSASTPIVELRNVNLRYGNIQVLERIDLSVAQGEVVALVGENGAGKSSLVRIMSGDLVPTSGQVVINGKEVPKLNPTTAVREGIETVMQNGSGHNHLSIAENFFLGREERLLPPLPFLARRRMRRLTKRYIDELGFDFHKQPGHPMSLCTAGERQMLEVARACYFHRTLMILDEATSSLSKYNHDRVIEVVSAAKRRGSSVVFVSHRAEDVYKYADRFVLLYGGRSVVKLTKQNSTLRDLQKWLISSHLSTVKQMAESIAHQIRNPLAIITVSAQMLRDEFAVQQNDTEFRNKLRRILNEVDMVELFVNSFLRFTHEQGVYPAEHDVRSVIEEAVHRVPEHKRSKVTIDVRVTPTDSTYFMLRSNVVQVLINLFITVIDMVGDGATIGVYTTVGKVLTIEVRYRGVRIPSGKREELHSLVSVDDESASRLGVVLFHHFFQRQRCTIELGQYRENENFVRLIF